MKHMLSLRICLVGLSLLATALVGRAESVTLRSGRVLAGNVRLEGADTVIVEATFPEVQKYTLKRDELTPGSLYDVLERRGDPKDAAQRRALGELAEQAGLKGMAVADYRAVKQLDPSSAREMDGRVARLLEEIAADVLEDARDLLEEDNPDAALMYLHTILEIYPDTKAAKEAKALMLDVHKTVGTAASVATKTVDEKEAPKLLEEVETHIESGDKKLQGARGHESASVSDQRAVERAIKHYEKGWSGAQKLPVSVAAADLKQRIEAARAKARSRLAEAYLTAGSIHLQRRSIPSAERFCNKACLLDPENKPNHDLHRLILQAKAYSGGILGF